MTCSRIEKLLSAYIDKELNEEEYFAVRRHLTMCSECNKIYEDLVSVKRCFDNLNIAEPPEDMIANIRMAIIAGENSVKKPEPKAQWWRPVFNFAKFVVPAAMIGTAAAIPLVSNITNINLFAPFAHRSETQPVQQANLMDKVDPVGVPDVMRSHSDNNGVINSATSSPNNTIKLTNASTMNSTIYKNNLSNYINEKKSYDDYYVELSLDGDCLAYYINSWLSDGMSNIVDLPGGSRLSSLSLDYDF